jgi:hypothetical protein
MLVVSHHDEGRARRRLTFPHREEVIHTFAAKAGPDTEHDRLLERNPELAPHRRAIDLAATRVEAGHVHAVAHDRDVVGRYLRIRREDLVSRPCRYGENGAIASGR